MNNNLKDRIYDIPEDILKKINHTIFGLQGKHMYGVDRAKTLVSEKKVKYGQLKRIIHDLKNIDKINDRVKYDLYGGDLMEKWANTFLNTERDQVKTKKKGSQKVNNNTGLHGFRKNPFLKKHTKKDSNKIPLNFMKSNSQKTSISPITSIGLFEEIERIKKIINY